jgi:hypothetical protein
VRCALCAVLCPAPAAPCCQRERLLTCPPGSCAPRTYYVCRLRAILAYRRKYGVDELDPRDALTHPCKAYWVGEIAPQPATRAHVKVCGWMLWWT